ncbi:hypothetical protein M0R04_00260 [Candidatus Dojkabacteria bacterium]|jgi:DNA-binding beta-propeller fold protein YncE|nr:hypothetical protein [Candidatus Dojkabacteria bacterium]
MKKLTNKLFQIVLLSGIFTFLFLFSSLLKAQASTFTTDTIIPSSYENVGTPKGLVVLPNGNIWYADDLNNRIIMINQTGEILRTVGRLGSAEGEFEATPTAITVDDEGYLYVLEWENCKVDKLDSNGGFVMSWGDCDVANYNFVEANSIHYDAFSDSIFIIDKRSTNTPVLKFSKYGEFISKFGTTGTGNGQFDEPFGVTTDSAGKIYVTDSGDNQRVQVFDHDYHFLFKFGSTSPGDYFFNAISGIEVLTNGDIVVASQNNYELKVFSSTGVYKSTIGELGEETGQFHSPAYLSIDSTDNIYVSDWGLKRIQKFTSTGVFEWAFGNNSTEPDHFSTPTAVAYDSEGNLYVLDNGYHNGRIQKFTNGGTYISTLETGEIPWGSWEMSIDATDRIFVSHDYAVTAYDLTGATLFTIGEGGTGDGQFNIARGIGFDTDGNIYVADNGNDRIQVFNSTGTYVSQWSTSQDGNPAQPETIYIDASNNVFVTQNSGGEGYDNHQIQKYDTSGVSLLIIPNSESVPIWLPFGVITDDAGNIYVSDRDAHHVLVLDSTGALTLTIGSYGGGDDQFNEPAGVIINPVTSSLTVADSLNNRIQSFGSGVRILNLIPSTDVLRTSDDLSLTKNYVDPEDPGVDSITSNMYFGEYIVSDFTVDLTADRNWATVNAVSLPSLSKSLITNLNPETAPGVSETHSIYVVKQDGQDSVHICPDATILDEVFLDCPNGYDLTALDENVSVETIDTVEYWKVTGFAGTGALSVATTGLDIVVSDNDVMVNDPITMTVTAHTTGDVADTTYKGSVTFSSTATSVTLPTNYWFTTDDAGVHIFTNSLKFATAGTYTVTVTDTENSGFTTTSASIVVNPLPVVPTDEEEEEDVTPRAVVETVSTEDTTPETTIPDSTTPDTTTPDTTNHEDTSGKQEQTPSGINYKVIIPVATGSILLIILIFLFLAAKQRKKDK